MHPGSDGTRDVACPSPRPGTHTSERSGTDRRQRHDLVWHHGDRRFDSRSPATAAAVAPSRTAFEHWLRSTAADEDTVDELKVVFSELVSNAVEATPEPHQEVEASAWSENGNIVLRVVNPVRPSAMPVMEPDLDDPLRPRGRGLLIVRAYTDIVEIESDSETIAIRCERRISD